MGSRRLPPLNALRAFEVSARLGSFSAAAAELGVTHGAISRQVAALEDWFGHRLFVREGRGVVPTGPGRTFASEVSAALDRLAEAAAHHGPGRERDVLRVNAPATFAMRWLIPRLPRFDAAHPDIAVEVSTSVSLAGRLKGGYDLAIRKGGESWDRHEATRFLDEADTVIASPALLARTPLRGLDDLAHHTLLATETRPGDWADWLGAAGLGLVPGSRQMRFDHFFVTLQAATDGLGLAVGPFPVLDGDVASGRFATPFATIKVPRPSYFLLVPADADKTRALRSFTAWLVAEGESGSSSAKRGRITARHRRKEPALFDRDRLGAIAARLDRDVAAGAIPGAALLIGDREADLFAHETGFRDVATRDPLGADAIWRIYSMTKPIVTMAGLALMERGILRLDQAVSDLIPAFADLAVALPDGSLVRAERAPTIQDLMRHTAGLGYAFLAESPAQHALVADGLLMEDLTNADFVGRLAALPLEHQPGRVWHYSHATDVLGHALEVVTCRDLQGVLDDTLFGPLGMSETWFRVPKAQAQRIAEPLPGFAHTRPNFTDPCAPRRSQRGNWGLFSTMADQAAFLRMMLCSGRHGARRVMSAATIALATADHLGRDIVRGAYYPPGPGYGFGLGFAVRLAAGEAAYPGSVGDYFWSGIGGTYFWVDPARGFFTVLMMQTSDAAQRAHYRALLRAMIYAALDD